MNPHWDAGGGRRSAAPASLMVSLLLHLVFALVVMTAWKTGSPLRLTEVTLMDTAPPAVKAGQEQEVHTSVRTKTPIKKTVREKSHTMPKNMPAARPVKAVKPVAVATPAPQGAVHEEAEKAAPVPESTGTVATSLREPHIETTALKAAKGVESVSSVPETAAVGTEPIAAGPAGPVAPDIDSLRRTYTDRLKELIERYIHYPVFARRAGLEGTCMVTCKLMRTGDVLNIEVAKSTGHGLLDKAALKAVSDVGSFPPPPGSLCDNELDIEIPVTFSLTGR